ncbi:MAG: MEDS domain-containing protein [Deltaproteobacteria bacterium]|nr:MEDS domain-containing protein [Deltaproteobacteria bacterium]
MDIKAAAGFLNVSEMTIRRWTNSGTLKCYRLGGKRERRFHMSDLEELLRGSQNHRLKSLGFGEQKAPDGSHLTHFYSGKEAALEVSVPYILEGLRQKEVVLAVMPPEKGRKLLAKLERERNPVATWIKNGRLNVTEGKNSPNDMINYLAGFAGKADNIRVVGDMIWTVRKGWDLAALRALEEGPNRMPPIENALLLCQYSLEDFSGAYIMMASELHSHTIYKGRLEKSPYYVHKKKE